MSEQQRAATLADEVIRLGLCLQLAQDRLDQATAALGPLADAWTNKQSHVRAGDLTGPHLTWGDALRAHRARLKLLQFKEDICL